MCWTVRVQHGSAPRLSQPLSGFLAGSSSRPSRIAAARGLFPSRAFPSRRSRAPLEAASSPAVSHRPSPSAMRAPFTAGFTHSRVAPPLARSRSAVAWLPRRLWAPFPRGSCTTFRPFASALPGRPGPTHRDRSSPGQLHLLRSLDPSVESVRTPVGLPSQRGRCSPGVRPSRAFLRPGPGPYLTRVPPPVGMTHELALTNERARLSAHRARRVGLTGPDRPVTPRRQLDPSEDGSNRAASRRQS